MATKKKTAKKSFKKPKLYKKEYYYWTDITKYIEDKYSMVVRDWAGKFRRTRYDPNIPYQDFWHSILNKFHIIEGNYETWAVYWGEYYDRAEEWEKEIIDILIKEGFDGVEINFSW